MLQYRFPDFALTINDLLPAAPPRGRSPSSPSAPSRAPALTPAPAAPPGIAPSSILQRMRRRRSSPLGGCALRALTPGYCPHLAMPLTRDHAAVPLPPCSAQSVPERPPSAGSGSPSLENLSLSSEGPSRRRLRARCCGGGTATEKSAALSGRRVRLSARGGTGRGGEIQWCRGNRCSVLAVQAREKRRPASCLTRCPFVVTQRSSCVRILRCTTDFPDASSFRYAVNSPSFQPFLNFQSFKMAPSGHEAPA